MLDTGYWVIGWMMNVELAKGEQAFTWRLCGGLVRLQRIE